MQHASGPGQLSLMGEVLPVPMVVSPVVLLWKYEKAGGQPDV